MLSASNNYYASLHKESSLCGGPHLLRIVGFCGVQKSFYFVKLFLKGNRVEIVNTLVIISYIALNLDVLLQNYRVYQIRESVDISLTGVVLRLFAVAVLAFKFHLLSEWALYIGQTILAINVGVYLLLVTRYRYKKKHGHAPKTGVKRKSKKY